MPRLLAGITDGGAGLHGALTLDRAGAGEDRLEQSRLAALERAHERNAPWTRGSCAILCHVSASLVHRGLLGTVGAGQPSFQTKGGIGKRFQICAGSRDNALIPLPENGPN